MRNKYRPVRLFAALMTLLLLSGCAKAPETAQTPAIAFQPSLDTSMKQTITVISGFGNFEPLNRAATAFKHYYPNVTVIHERLDNYERNAVLRVSSDPTVALFAATAAQLTQQPELLEYAAELSREAVDLSGVNPAACKAGYVNGRLMVIPLWFRFTGMVVNTTLLEREGLTRPTCYSEFVSCCEQLREKGYVPLQGPPQLLKQFFVSYANNNLYHHHTREEYDALASGAEGSAAILNDAFEMALQFGESGLYTQESLAAYEDDYDQAILRFFEGDVPFMACTTDTMTGMKGRETKSAAFTASPFAYEFSHAPLGETNPCAYIGVDYGLAINDRCAYRELAVEFFRFLYSNDTLNLMSTVKGAPSAAASPSRTLYKQLISVPEECMTFPWYFDDRLYAVDDCFAEAIGEILTGRLTTASDAAAHMEALLRAQE